MNENGKNRAPTVMLAAGGTSGHINPALAIATEIRRHCPEVRLIFCGLKDNLEEEMAARETIPFFPIAARGLPTRKSPHVLRWVRDNMRGIRQAKNLISREKPALIIGTGGYVMAPVLMAAQRMKVPYVLHEQNTFPGRANRFFARRARYVFVSEPHSVRYFPKRANTVLTGNPVQPIFYELDTEKARKALHIDRDCFLIIVSGGSLGASTLNRAVCDMAQGEAWKAWTDAHPETMIMLSTGQEAWDKAEPLFTSLPHVHAIPYMHNMAYWLAAADFVVSRAGAMSCAEIATLGKPSVLVPYPLAAGDHQTLNAKALQETGGATVCRDEAFNADCLFSYIQTFGTHPERLSEMGERVRLRASDSPAARIFEYIRPYLCPEGAEDA